MTLGALSGPIARDAKPNEVSLRVLAPALLAVCLASGLAAQPKVRFNASQIEAPGSGLLSCDLDGDGLKDLVLLDHLKLSIFYQASGQGFSRTPELTWELEPKPCLLWTARLGGKAESVLVMTSDGVSELCFTNRAGPPVQRQLIRQRTLVPESAQTTNALYLPLSALRGDERKRAARAEDDPENWPLLLVPATNGLQVWQHQTGQWTRVQVIAQAIRTELWPSLANPGYTVSSGFGLSVSDVNGDGREDLMVRHTLPNQTNSYALYLQQTDGTFTPEPAMTYSEKVTPSSWLCWADLNHDGRVDLVRSVWLNDPSLVPGVPSAKVVVGIHLADERGRIPARPSQVLRKSDWVAPLPVLDVDGDGFPDLVLGYTQIESPEGVRKAVTARQLDYSLRFFFYRPGTGYPSQADCQRDIVLHADRSDFSIGWSLPQNFERFVKLGGDFNGDGKADLLVRERSEDISVYCFVSREQGFSAQPDLRFSCPEPIAGWQVMDLNGDGVSDLVVRLQKPNTHRVFVSQKSAQ